jgi:AcrR family transcriptional regulator
MTSLTQKDSSRHGGRGARKRILDAASELVYFEGINATGFGRIASKASVSKRTICKHFPSNSALVEEYLPEKRRHFDVVAAAKTASLMAVGVIATMVFWARLAMSNK